MKHSGWLFFLLLISLPAKAQMERGRWQIAAELNQFNYEKVNTLLTTSKVLLTPSLGYFLEKNLLISLGLPLGISSNIDPYVRNTQTRIGVSPSIRYYFSQSNWKPFLGFSYSYMANKNTYKILDDRYSGNDYSNLFIPSVGLAYCLTHRVTVVTSLNYLIDNSGSDILVIPGTSNHTNVVDRPNYKSLSVGLGIQFFLIK